MLCGRAAKQLGVTGRMTHPVLGLSRDLGRRRNLGYSNQRPAEESPMVTIRATFDGRVFVPEEPVNLPVGYVVEILIPSLEEESGEKPLAEHPERRNDLPANPDVVGEHDPYYTREGGS
jgi:hypothetical protein